MPTFDVQAALQNGVSQEKIDAYLAANPDVQTNEQPSANPITPSVSSTTESTPASILTGPTPQNSESLPVVGSIQAIGQGLGGANTGGNGILGTGSDMVNQARGDLADVTQKLIHLASQESDPVKRAHLLQVAHDNVTTMNTVLQPNAEKGQKIASAGETGATLPVVGKPTPITSIQQAAGTALKTVSAAAPESQAMENAIAAAKILGIPLSSLAITGGLYGAGNTLEKQGKDTTTSSLALHSATNAAGFWLGGQVLSKLIDATGFGNAAANTASKKLMQDAQTYRDSIGQQLNEDAQNLSKTNPKAIINIANKPSPQTVRLAQNLVDSNLPQETLNKLGGDLTPSDIQNISSRINYQTTLTKSADAIDKLNTLNRNFRSWAQTEMNAVSPGTGDALEKLYDVAQTKYQGMEMINNVFKPNSNPTSEDISQLREYIQQQWQDPSRRLALKAAIQQWGQTSGVDITDPVKAAAYENTLPGKTKAVWSALKWVVGAIGVGEAVKHSPF